MKLHGRVETEIEAEGEMCSRDCTWIKYGGRRSICRLYGGEHLEPCGKSDYRGPQCLADFGTGESITAEKYADMTGQKHEPTPGEIGRKIVEDVLTALFRRRSE